MTAAINLVTSWDLPGYIRKEDRQYKLTFGNFEVYANEIFTPNDILRLKNIIDDFIWTFYTEHFFIDEFHVTSDFIFDEKNQQLQIKVETTFIIPFFITPSPD